MRKSLLIAVLLFFAGLVIYFPSFRIFFAQDDFILINYFSQNSFLTNLLHVFGPPTVSHFRPLFNLFFLIGGSLFGKNYFLYHVLLLLIHVVCAFLIYEFVKKIFKDERAASISSLIYVVHPAHFNSVFWISGCATMIGFLFLLASLNCFARGKNLLSFVFYIFALLASEAMVVGLAIFLLYEILFNKRALKNVRLGIIFASSAIFLVLRLLFLTSPSTYDAYRVEFSLNIFATTKYYLLRVLGFIEGNGLKPITTLTLITWTLALLLGLFRNLKMGGGRLPAIFSAVVVAAGMFPFVLIPGHLSANYMNISIFGFSMMVGLILVKPFGSVLNTRFAILWILIFTTLSFINVRSQISNSWVVKRADLAKVYIDQIKKDDPPPGAKIVFTDNRISSSLDAYYALGTGEAVEFWFRDKHYKTCFEEFEKC